eukprot:6455276-Amphidinium_carterae.2
MSKRRKGAKQPTSKDEPYYDWELEDGDASIALGLETGLISDCSTDSDNLGGSAAVDKLKELLVKEHRSGNMHAKTLCQIAHWATQGGLSGLESLAMAPSSSSGNFSRHLQAVYQKEGQALAAHFLYHVALPGYKRSVGGRSTIVLPFVPLHEVMMNEMEYFTRNAVEELFAQWTPPPNYREHPIVQRSRVEGKRVIPYYLFVHGVSYGKKNSVIVFSATNMLTNTRHLIGLLRKRVICGNKGCCSCSGWCTLHVVWLFIAYCVEQFGQGRFSEKRFPNHLDEGLVNGWGPADGHRRAKAGEAMPFAGTLLQVRADWAEISHT